VEIASPGAQRESIGAWKEMEQGFLFNVVRRHGRYFGIVHDKDLAIPIDAHPADTEFAGIDETPPLANMTPHPAARERLIEHRLPFHPPSLYHQNHPDIASRRLGGCVGKDGLHNPTLQNLKPQVI
jgi:hypothetical protein